MADTKTIGEDPRKPTPLRLVNPLIDIDGDSSHVESVLSLLSFLVLDATRDGLTLCADQAHGLVLMLNTCEAALKAMRDAGEA